MNVNQTYNGEAHEERPETSPGILLRSLPDTHLMLVILAIEGFMHQIGVIQNLRLVDVHLLGLRLLIPLFGDAFSRHLVGYQGSTTE